MNNTRRRTLAIVVLMLTAATLVVGAGTFTTTTTGQSAYAYKKDNGKGNGNGNTVTIQKCKQAAIQSGWDNDQEQECENLICTHPGENATCTQEGFTSTPSTPIPTPEPTAITTTLRVIKRVVCQPTDPDCSLPPGCQLTVFSGTGGSFSAVQQFSCQSAIGNGVVVTLQPDTFFFLGEALSQGFETTTTGDCFGTIAAGQHLTCTITNTEMP